MEEICVSWSIGKSRTSGSQLLASWSTSRLPGGRVCGLRSYSAEASGSAADALHSENSGRRWREGEERKGKRAMHITIRAGITRA